MPGLSFSEAEISLFDALKKTFVESGTTFLPFGLAEVVDNLRYELYTEDIPGGSFINPALAVSSQESLQPS